MHSKNFQLTPSLALSLGVLIEKFISRTVQNRTLYETLVNTKVGVVLEKPCKLMFELSSSERVNLLLKLQKQKMKLSHISEKLDMTITETSRHLQRLSEAKLIQKDVNGLYGLTHFGNLALALISGICCISKNTQYFSEHDLSHLPSEFIERLGELSSIPPGTSDIMTVFA